MTAPKDLLALAERCEAAEAADFHLDCAIALASGQFVREKRDRDRKEWFYPVGQDYGRKSISPFFHGADRIPRYTGSIDAALQLVPEGWSEGYERDSRFEEPGKSYAWVWPHDSDYHPDWQHAQNGYAKTPALALCAAALRARSHQENDNAE